MRLIIVIVAFWSLAGCSSKVTSASPCGKESKCDPGFVCINDVCRRVCTASRDCDADQCCSSSGYCDACTGMEPEIVAIDSDGSEDSDLAHAPHRLGTSMIITGNNLAGASVDLQAADPPTNNSHTKLPLTQSTSSRLVATLPLDLQQGTYAVVVSNQTAADQVTATVLQGEPGRDGADLNGDEIIVKINEARTGGTPLVADQLGDLGPTELARVADIPELAERATALEANLGALQSTGEWVCPGLLIRGVCVLAYSNENPGFTWGEAVNNCTAAGGDLCTAAQYVPLRGEGWVGSERTLFDSKRAVWTADFSDNDGGVKSNSVYSADNPSITNNYYYACCQNIVPEPYRSRADVYAPQGTSGNGVWVTYVHKGVDTTFPAAAHICARMGSDLCSKSQYVALRDNGLFDTDTPVWTNEMSDNDANDFNEVIGPTADNPGWNAHYAYACCASQRPLDGSCPGIMYGGVCTLEIHDVEDQTFNEAARICTAQGADLCSKSQMQVLRNQPVFNGEVWTNDGADNDSTQVGGLISSQPDNPKLSDQFGYACCL